MPQIIQQVQKVLAGNRITIFDKARRKLGLNVGDFVIVQLENGNLKVIPAEVKPKKVESQT